MHVFFQCHLWDMEMYYSKKLYFLKASVRISAHYRQSVGKKHKNMKERKTDFTEDGPVSRTVGDTARSLVRFSKALWCLILMIFFPFMSKKVRSLDVFDIH